MKDQNDPMPVEMARFFDERATSYDDHQRGDIPYFESIHKVVAAEIEETTSKVRILDLGCGTGVELEGILTKAPNAQITCIDISRGMLDELKRKYSQRMQNIEVVNGSFMDTPFRQTYYDYAVSVLSMHHLTYERKLNIYRRIRNALALEGQYIEADHILPTNEERTRLAWYNRQLEAQVISPDEEYHIDIPFSVSTQRQLLLEAGFSQVRTLFKTTYALVLSAR